ncbi:restriction endonuclease subunit S [uncultured Xanthomonas sp.]|uniref:restriction endonuclease subunit S n=1 Tax=uncultured Xanthomonas sp. TaxID=152831 RepID=UPI0025D13DDA|nr:restriction endonuclease subunit S [uncultured Xanthomonas sp.]
MKNEWRKVSLGEVIELKRGYDLPQALRKPGNVPLVSSSGISDTHAEAMVSGPGVVTGRYGTIGQVFFIDEDFWPLNTTLYVRDFKGNDPRFISYFLKTLNFLAYSDKAAVPGLNRNDLHRAQVCLPSDIGEQRAIAQILGTLDDKINLNRHMSETLETMASALFKSWFWDFDNVPPESMQETELGSIPKGWSKMPVSNLIDFNPAEPLRKGTPTHYLDMASLPTKGSWPEPPVIRAFGSGMRFRNGDTLLARITPCLENGKTAFIQCLPKNTLAWGSTEFIVMRPKAPVPAEYAYLLARDASFREHAIRNMTGTSGRQRVQADSIAQFKVASPGDPKLWKEFADFVSPLFNGIKANSESSQSLSELRDSLLPKLISGGIRVKNFENLMESEA